MIGPANKGSLPADEGYGDRDGVPAYSDPDCGKFAPGRGIAPPFEITKVHAQRPSPSWPLPGVRRLAAAFGPLRPWPELRTRALAPAVRKRRRAAALQRDVA